MKSKKKIEDWIKRLENGKNYDKENVLIRSVNDFTIEILKRVLEDR